MSLFRQCLTALMAVFVISASGLSQEIIASVDEFEVQEYNIRGSVVIEDRADGRYVVFSEDFRTRRAPDLKIFVSTLLASEINGDNASAAETSILVAELDRARGAQEYRLPDNLDLDTYSTLIIHCEQFSKLWGASSLS